MRTHILSALFTGVLSLAAVGCGDTGNDGSLSESALKKGTLDDAGTCVCAKGMKDKAGKDAGKSKPEKDAGEKGQGGGKSDEEHGKSDQEHGKGSKDAGADEDEAGDEDATDEEEFEALKVYPDGGMKAKKPKKDKGEDCTC
jgi:hypothetical protein